MSLKGGIKTCFSNIPDCKETAEAIVKNWKEVDSQLLSELSDAWYFHDESGADLPILGQAPRQYR